MFSFPFYVLRLIILGLGVKEARSIQELAPDKRNDSGSGVAGHLGTDATLRPNRRWAVRPLAASSEALARGAV